MSFLPITLELFGILIAIIALGISFIKWRFQYWKNRQTPFLEPKIPYGNMEPPYNRTINFGEHIKKLYDQTRSKNWKFSGIYLLTSPVLLVTDLDLLKNIMAKDFHHFSERGFYYNEKDDPISAHIFALGGKKWRNLRAKLTPTFTSGKIKQMFQTLVDCGQILDRLMETKYHKPNEPIDIKEILGCFTTDVIGSCAFGLDCNTFDSSEESPFRVYGRKMFEQTRFQAITNIIKVNFPKLALLLHMRAVKKDISEFFTKVVTETVEYREKNNVERKDFLQLLINIKNNRNFEPEDYENENINTLTMDQVVAQSFIFFIGGFETSSTLTTFALYEMSKNPEIQEKVRTEIRTVLAKHDGKITYDSVNEMKYMSQVLDETSRKNPPVTFLTRECSKDYRIPDTDIILEEGIKVLIPIYGIHMDPEYYPEPQKFDPERFSEENKQKRHQYTLLPFGEGQRICIGMRFGLMQAKVALTILLRKYKFSVNPRTKEPLKIPIDSLIYTNEGGIWLDAKELK